MVPEEISQSHFTPSSTLDLSTHRKTERDISIQPWNIGHIQALPCQMQFPTKNCRLRTLHPRTREFKQIEGRVGPLSRRQSNEGILYTQNSPNSRELYRQKLREIENGPEFRRIGSKREPTPSFYLWQSQPEQLTVRRGNVYCCEYSTEGNSPRKLRLQSKCSDKFQRMLKLKDKIRRKNNLAVTKQREKFMSEYEAELMSPTEHKEHKEPKEAMAKATIQRNKLKLKMRGLSQEIRKKNQHNFAIQSRNMQFKATKEGLALVYDKQKGLPAELSPEKIEKMSQTLSYFTR